MKLLIIKILFLSAITYSNALDTLTLMTGEVILGEFKRKFGYFSNPTYVISDKGKYLAKDIYSLSDSEGFWRPGPTRGFLKRMEEGKIELYRITYSTTTFSGGMASPTSTNTSEYFYAIPEKLTPLIYLKKYSNKILEEEISKHKETYTIYKKGMKSYKNGHYYILVPCNI